MPDDNNFSIRLKRYDVLSLNAAGSAATAKLVYQVDNLGGAATLDILHAVRLAAPETIESAIRATVDLVELPHADTCTVAVNYTPASSSKTEKRQRRVGDVLWSFEAGEGEITAVTALEQVTVIDNTTGQALTPNIGNQIGWNGKYGAESACAGCRVHTAATRLTCRRTVAASTAQSSAFQTGITDLQDHVNSATFHGYAAGQVLFVGATGGEEYYNDLGDLVVDVTYRFLVAANEAARSVGDVTFPAVNGWDYAWTITQYDLASERLETVAGVVSRVYAYSDLTNLGIGSE